MTCLRSGQTVVLGSVFRDVSERELRETTTEVFGEVPHDWQVKVALKILKDNDVSLVAGTGAGKSRVFGLLAVGAELANSNGLILVICPLKSLEEDQVSRIAREWQRHRLKDHRWRS